MIMDVDEMAVKPAGSLNRNAKVWLMPLPEPGVAETGPKTLGRVAVQLPLETQPEFWPSKTSMNMDLAPAYTALKLMFRSSVSTFSLPEEDDVAALTEHCVFSAVTLVPSVT